MDFHQALLTPWMLKNSHEGIGSNLGGNPDCRRLIGWGKPHFPLLSFPFPYFCWHPNLWPSAHWQEAGNWRPSSLVTANNSWASATSKRNDQQLPQNSRSLSKNARNKSSKERLTPSSPCDSRISKPLLAAPTIERTLKGIQRRGAWEPGTSSLVQPTAQMSIAQILFPWVLTFRMNMWDRANYYYFPRKSTLFLNFRKILQLSSKKKKKVLQTSKESRASPGGFGPISLVWSGLCSLPPLSCQTSRQWKNLHSWGNRVPAETRILGGVGWGEECYGNIWGYLKQWNQV